MSIRISNVISAYEVYSPAKPYSSRVSRAQEKKDAVALSEQAKNYQTAAKAIRALPDVRADLVADIQSKMESGAYSVATGDLADKILGSL